MEVEIGSGAFGIEYSCADCGSVLMRDRNRLTHRRYHPGFLSVEDRSKPIDCKWAGHFFEVPKIQLRSLAVSVGTSQS
jgi:hypothetical protein